MKWNLTVLVLLVTWSLMSMPSLSPVCFADDNMESDGLISDLIQGDIIMEADGGGDDDDQEGDPGDAGDGYGATDPDGVLGGNSSAGDPILDEFMLILMSLIQLAL